jgi:hypothetical protein
VSRTLADDFKPAVYNPRRITPEKLGLLKNALARFGDLGGIVLNRRTGTIVGGHQRLKHIPTDQPIVLVHEYDEPTDTGTAALGFVEYAGELFAVRVVDVDEKTEAVMNLRANADAGEFEIGEVIEILSQLDAQGWPDLSLTGFTDSTVERFLTGNAEAHVDQDGAQTYEGKFEVVIECEDGAMQEHVFNFAKEQGWKARVLTL